MKYVLILITSFFGLSSLAIAQRAGSGMALSHSFQRQMAATSAGSFPYDSAGIVAYTQIPPASVNIQKGAAAFSKLLEVGDNYALGVVNGKQIYFDTNGWVVSYLPKGALPAQLVATYDTTILTNTSLSIPIRSVLQKMGVNTHTYSVQYSDLDNPSADSLLVFWASTATNRNVYFEIPSSYTLLSQTIAYSGGWTGSHLSLDGNIVAKGVGTFTVAVDPGVGIPHVITEAIAGELLGGEVDHFAYVILY